MLFDTNTKGHKNVVPEAGIQGRHKSLYPTDTVARNYLSPPFIPAPAKALIIRDKLSGIYETIFHAMVNFILKPE